MTPRARKLALTAHVVSSVGWLGAVGAFLALAVTGLSTGDPGVARAAYVATETITWFVIVPLSGAALVTGLVQALGTAWGLARHYWVLVKLLMTVVATAVLLLHTRPIGVVAAEAARGTLTADSLRPLRVQLVADAGAALLVLVVAAVLSVYKPRGLTRFGRRARA
ncbi:MAG: hypothetical protein AB1416_07230 [Actinomycetota bacterium]